MSIRNRRTAALATAPMVNGGLDPLGIEANAGDTLQVAVLDANGAVVLLAMAAVPARARPRVVRTSPPPMRRDVPLNASIVIVFSEPIDSSVVTGSAVQLRQGTSVIGAQLRFADPRHLTLELTPAAPLAGGADYRLVVTTAVADLAGDALDSTVTVDFTTAPSPLGPPVAGLAFTVQPTNVRVGALIQPAIEVSLLDSLGNVIPTATDSVWLDLGRVTPNGSSFGSGWGGSRVVAAANGVAVFTDLAALRPGIGWAYQAWTAGAGLATSATFTATVPAQLEIRTPYTSASTSTVMGILEVAVLDTLGDLDSNASAAVTVALGANPGGATLTGTLSRVPAGGLATFTDLRLDQTGSGYTLVASAPGYASAVSPPFQVSAAAPSAGQLAFVRDGRIHLVNADGTGLVPLTAGPDDRDPAWSPDGQRIAFTRGRDSAGVRLGDLYAMAADGSGLTRRTSGWYLEGPSWSPDGKSILFAAISTGSMNVFVVTAENDGSAPVLVVDRPGFDAQPAWSPDGSRIAFVSDWAFYDYAFDIYVATPSGAQPTALTNSFQLSGVVEYWHPAFSPNGQAIAALTCPYGFYTCLQGAIAIMNADGSGLRPVVATAGGGSPTWSPDGLTIAFGSAGAIGWVRADGTAQGVIVTNGHSPAWRP